MERGENELAGEVISDTKSWRQSEHRNSLIRALIRGTTGWIFYRETHAICIGSRSIPTVETVENLSHPFRTPLDLPWPRNRADDIVEHPGTMSPAAPVHSSRRSPHRCHVSESRLIRPQVTMKSRDSRRSPAHCMRRC